MRYIIILSGGVGSRFWPLSRQKKPKQFLKICSNSSLIEETLKRIRPLVPAENTYIAASSIHGDKMKLCLRKYGIPLKNVLLEPKGKNTLGPIAILSKRIVSIDSEAVITVLPCDHFVKDKARFIELIKKGIDIAQQGYIVTLGVLPNRPEIGYGYIKIKSRHRDFCTVDKFIEKPNLRRVRAFLKDKRYYWNAGIFIFRADIMLGEISRYAKATYKIITEIKGRKSLNKLWQRLPFISIDYAVMEHSRKIALLPADYGWTDLGSWQSLGEVIKKDRQGNIFKGNCIDMDSRNSIVWSEHKLAATLGLDNIFVINTEDALLVCRADRAQEIKELVELLKQRKLHRQT
jgi:mannose-1-phosphate guanylyltransferase/mannose-6-phosphate isomerase